MEKQPPPPPPPQDEESWFWPPQGQGSVASFQPCFPPSPLLMGLRAAGQLGRVRCPHKAGQGFKRGRAQVPPRWAPVAPANHPHQQLRGSLEPGGAHPLFWHNNQAECDKVAPQASDSGQSLTSVDNGIHFQLGDVPTEQGDFLIQLFVLLIFGVLHLHSHPWNRQR